MSDKKPEGLQLPTIQPSYPYIQESFDLNRQDAFVKSLGSTFYHWKATPSPIGLNDRGDYRRNNEVDVMTSNGYIYSFGGKFTGTMTGNQKDQKRPSEGALIDVATANLICPRFYNDASDAPVLNADANGGPGSDQDNCNDCSNESNQQGGCVVHNGAGPKRMYFTPGDRLYSDPTINDLVVNKELMTYSYDSVNVPMFPIVQMDAPLIDSRGIRYAQGSDYDIDCNGNLVWLTGGNNPGIDPDTGAGRTYSIRYLYRAFYYVHRILREVRVTEVTEGSVRRPERMAYFIEIIREYLFHNINKGNELNKPPVKAMEKRQTVQPLDNIGTNQGIIRVETQDIESDT